MLHEREPGVRHSSRGARAHSMRPANRIVRPMEAIDGAYAAEAPAACGLFRRTTEDLGVIT